jgi:DmsE family decaheme c-type cytochrome
MKRFGFYLMVFGGALFALLARMDFGSEARGDTSFAGSESCKGCHEAYFNAFSKSVHGKKAVPRNPANREGCESCHGPGAEHAEKGGGRGVAIFSFGKKTDPREKAAKCLECHGADSGLASWDLSKHKSFDVSCDNCHSMHMEKPAKHSLRIQDPLVCFECHRNIRAQTNKQSHHPIREGKIKCDSCHNPHGTFDNKSMLKADTLNELCYNCHAEKRGPYAFEHDPVHENCMICHEVHGSNHSGLLVRKVPSLCQECHSSDSHSARGYTNLHSFNGPATSNKNRFFARGCLNCHGNIHGSSLSEFFTR